VPDIRDEVRQILLADWDDSRGLPDRHDLHLDALIAIIRNSADESPIVEFLHERERESMCFPSLGTARLKPVARKLLALRPLLSEN
jgi:hypothetical protein